MSAPGRSLQDLVRHAVERLRWHWADETGPGHLETSRAALVEGLALILGAAEQRDFLQARRVADGLNWHWVGDYSPLRCFQEACQLAERIDCLLALPLPGVAAALARSCRNDLDLLAVLADWLAENDRPAAAAEARHLLSLVRSQPPPHPLGRPPDWWEDVVLEYPDEEEMEDDGEME